MSQAFSLPSLSLAQEDLLRSQIFDDHRPGTVLADFEMLLDCIGTGGLPVGGKYGLLPLKTLADLNARLAEPLRVAMKRPLQKSYPVLHGLYLLLRATGLGRVRGAGKDQRLVLDPETLASWQGLNPTERYFALLEAWLLHARDSMVGERDNAFLGTHLFDAMQLFGAIDENQGSAGELLQDHYHNRYQGAGCNLPLMALFGLVDLEQGAPGPKGEWRVQTVRRRPFGQALLAAAFTASAGVDRGPSEEEEPEDEVVGRPVPVFGILQAGLADYFPAWRNDLILSVEEFREGVHVFRASLGRVWRQIAVAGATTLDDLAYAILGAFKFDSDHLYCFLLRDPFGVQVSVNAPYMEEGPWTPEILVGEVPLEVGQAMLFVFDFGDNWRFTVTLEEVRAPDQGLTNPAVLGGKGEAPEQYPIWDEGDDA